MSTRKPSAHMCVVDGYLYILLPSEKKEFRDQIKKIGVLVPFPAPDNESPGYSGPIYRLPAANETAFRRLVENMYPRWGFHRWGWREWDDIPPWVRQAINVIADEASARKETMRRLDA